MEDPGWAWPYWKFGLKKDDLFTTLQDRYNTFPSSIQDPEAFHHDVYEISREASSTDEFHRLMADRKQQRLRELDDSLESASLEIIANPSLIGTAQWQYALQLFRTKSLDSLVRYFASYLPDDHPWHKTASSSSSGSLGSCTDDSTTYSFFDEHDEKPALTHEPLCISTSIPVVELPLSPRSMSMLSDSSAASPTDLPIAHHPYIIHSLTPPRTLSVTDSEPDHFGLADSYSSLRDDDHSHSDPETPSTSVSDLSETRSLGEDPEEKDMVTSTVVSEESISFLPSHIPSVDSMESETPTPKPEPAAAATSFFDAKPSLPHRRHRSISPSRPHPLSQSPTLSHPQPQKLWRSPRLRRRDVSPGREGRRRSFGEPASRASRIQKPVQDPVRLRPKGRRRMLGC